MMTLYKRFPSKELAQETGELLAANKIPFQIEEQKSEMALGEKHEPLPFILKIDNNHFEFADNILLKFHDIDIEDVSKDHYLFTFTDEELIDILTKPDEWNAFDFQLAQKILKQRGKEVSADFLQSYRKIRIQELRQTEPPQKNMIRFGYVLAILGGFLGIGVGLQLWKSKKTLPNGDSIYSYNESDREHGKKIFIIGIICFSIALIYRVYEKF